MFAEENVAEVRGWSRSDSISLFALLVAGGALYLQYADRGVPYKVQQYIDKGQAADKIIESVEKLIHARQLAMITVEGNVYQPQWAKVQPLERLNADSKVARPVVEALGDFSGTLQNNVRYFQMPETLNALSDLNGQVDASVKCFTDIASVNHKVSQEQLENFRETIANSCAGANLPASLEALKIAEANAMSAMDAERAAVTGAVVQKPK